MNGASWSANSRIGGCSGSVSKGKTASVTSSQKVHITCPNTSTCIHLSVISLMCSRDRLEARTGQFRAHELPLRCLSKHLLRNQPLRPSVFEVAPREKPLYTLRADSAQAVTIGKSSRASRHNDVTFIADPGPHLGSNVQASLPTDVKGPMTSRKVMLP